MNLVSVIIPVYNVEPYLDRCIRSVVDQTYSNLEIILVDDGSTDGCPAMCDAWAAKDARIQVIHKENGGLSDARNAGMAVATGEYIGFVDSDDWISPEMYELLLSEIQTKDCDISACGVQMVWEDGRDCRMLTRSGNCVLENREAMQACVEETWMKQPVWNKLYRRKLIQGMAFPVGKYHEDVFWTYLAIGKARRVSVTDQPCYYYCQRNDSIMGKGYSLKRLDGLEAKQLRQQYIEKNYPDLSRLSKNSLFGACIYNGQMTLKYLHGEEKRVAKDRIDQIQRQNHPDRQAFRLLRGREKLWIGLACISFWNLCRLKNLLGRGF